MKIGQKLWTKEKGWVDVIQQTFPTPPQLVLAFGARCLMQDPQYFEEIKALYPTSPIITCSTAGEILDGRVRDNSIAVTAVLFEKSAVHFAQADIATADESAAVGKKLADMLPKKKSGPRNGVF